MAMTHDYLDYLNDSIGISPANSQEELQAAQVISELMEQHDVEATIEDFDAPKLAALMPAVLAVASLLGMLLVGFGVLPLTLVGLVLAAAPAVLSVLRLFGNAPALEFGPRAQSQNVVAVHRASGPLVTKGSRTIVVCAHYDSPRENFLYTSPVAPYVTLASRLSVPCSLGVAVCALLQLLGFLPAPLRVILWIAGILAAVPAVVVAAGSIVGATAPCTDGANDNKAGVAAMLGVLENVRPSGMVPKARPAAPAEEPSATAEDEAEKGDAPTQGEPAEGAPADGETPAPAAPAAKTVASAEAGPVLGVRHGEDVLRSLQILPPTCEIEYVTPAAPAPAAQQAPAAAPTDREETRPSERLEPTDAAEGPADATLATEATADADATQPTERVAAPAEKAADWGTTSFKPGTPNVARRASLFDLPDPSGNEVDPLAATNPSGTRVPAVTDAEPASAAQPLETISAPAEEEAPEDAPEPKRSPLSSLLDRLREGVSRLASRPAPAEDDEGEKDDEPEAEEDDDDRVWRGGAAPRSGLRLVGEDEQPVGEDAESDQPEGDAPDDEELRDEVLSLGDDALIAHDIWFVALGGSSLNHAGMRAFLNRHRSEIRGCFVINLDCVGAGKLSVLKSEGLEETRRADRRVSRLLLKAASDLHLDLASEPHDWEDTDATPAMRASLRSVTVMGLNEHGLPALSRTPEDVEDNVSGDQAAQVAALVTEVIRRS